MTTIELMQSIGQINDEFILEAKNIANAPKNTTWHGMKRSLLIAAIVVILLLLVGCTVSYFLYSSMMETIMGENGRSTYASDTVRGLYEPGGERSELNDKLAQKLIEPHILSAEGTITDGNTTLTVLSYIVDRTSCTAAIYLKLDNPPEYQVHNNGMILFAWEGKWDGWYIYPKPIGQDGIIGRCMIDHTSTTKDTLYCVIMFSCEPNCEALELQIGNAPDKVVIPLPEKTHLASITLENGDIDISPFGMKIHSCLLVQDDDPSPHSVSPHELAVQFKDGSEYLILHTGFISDEDYVGFTYGMALNVAMENRVFIFSRVVDIKQVSAIRINEHIYPVM